MAKSRPPYDPEYRRRLVKLVLRGLVLSGGVLLAGCGDAEEEAPCGYDWEGAPCGEEWWGRMRCDPDEVVYRCGYHSDYLEGALVWRPADWPCECIDDQGLIKDIPECAYRE